MKQRRSQKRKTSTNNKRYPIPIIAITLIILVITGIAYNKISTQIATNTIYETASERVFVEATEKQKTRNYRILTDKQCAVFTSYSDGNTQTHVSHGTGNNLKSAWSNADALVKQNVKETKIVSPKYIKYDVIYDIQEMSMTDFRLRLGIIPTESFPYGLMFNNNPDQALLYQELHTLIPYDTKTTEFDIKRLNLYFSNTGRQQLNKFPDTIQLFMCDSWLYDVESEQITELKSEKDGYGHRAFELNQENIANMLSTASKYLENHIHDDGSFEYQVLPLSLMTTDEYSTIRHIATLWAMCQTAKYTQNLESKTAIDKSLQYLMDYIIYDNDGDAYFIESYSDEAQIGGIALAIITLDAYEQTFGPNGYDELIQKLTNTLIKHQDSSGKIPHAYDRNFEVTQEFYTIFFEGETCLSLLTAYNRFKSPEILDAALKMFDYFETADHSEHADHWLAYTANELTKLYPTEQRYYNFAFKNVTSGFDTVEYRFSITPTDFELLANTYEIYLRAIENNIPIPKNFDAERLVRLTHWQAERQINSYLFPEKAMYTPICDEITGAFYVALGDDWRIRIDEIGHYTNGYWEYYKLLETA